MGKLIGLLVLTAVFNFAHAQVAVQINKGDIIYAGVDNTLTIVVAKSKPGSVSITTDNGKISGAYPDYEFVPEKTGKAELTIKWKTAKGKNDTFTKYFYAKECPNPTPYFAHKTGGELASSIARVQIAPSTIIFGGGDYGCANYVIDSFTIIVIRDEKVAYIKSLYNPHGVRFSDDDGTANFIKTLRNNDRLLFTGISCKGADSKSRHLQPMEFTLLDETGIEVNENIDK